jgi:hypothetical protein
LADGQGGRSCFQGELGAQALPDALGYAHGEGKLGAGEEDQEADLAKTPHAVGLAKDGFEDAPQCLQILGPGEGLPPGGQVHADEYAGKALSILLGRQGQGAQAIQEALLRQQAGQGIARAFRPLAGAVQGFAGLAEFGQALPEAHGPVQELEAEPFLWWTACLK